MNLNDFNNLDLNKRIEVVKKQGIYLDSHFTTKERCNLYAIDMFFAEVVYSPSANIIAEIRGFKIGETLNKYSIDLSNRI